jgi:hypothetical protein
VADDFNVLYQGVMITSVDEFFSISAGTHAIIKHISLVNTSANAGVTVQLYIGGTGDGNRWGPTRTLDADEADEWFGTLSLGESETLRGITSDATSITITVSGDLVTD